MVVVLLLQYSAHAMRLMMAFYHQFRLIWYFCLTCLPTPSQSSPLQDVQVSKISSNLLGRRESWFTPTTTATIPLREQFTHPAEVLAVLLLIGGDVIRKAIAQVAGRRSAPVTFSFGWVAYSFMALQSFWGDGHLLPEPDLNSIVINPKSGNVKQNESWVLGRLTRDLEIHFDKSKIKKELKKYSPTNENHTPPSQAEPPPDVKEKPGEKTFWIIRLEAMDVWKNKRSKNDKDIPDPPAHDKIWYSFFVVIFFQFGLAIAPIFSGHGNWRILFVTGVGTLLAVIHGSLPQWREEKYACSLTKEEKHATFILTRGNSHPYVFLIHSGPGRRCLNLEQLAVSRKIGVDPQWKWISILLVGFWIVLLIAIGGLAQDTWFLLGVGGLGMVHNIWVSGQPRDPAAHGIPLQLDAAVLVNDSKGGRVMDGLMWAEKREPGLGLALLKVFFPGRLDTDEQVWWEKASKHYGKIMEEEEKRRKEKAKAKSEKEEKFKLDEEGNERETTMNLSK